MRMKRRATKVDERSALFFVSCGSVCGVDFCAAIVAGSELCKGSSPGPGGGETDGAGCDVVSSRGVDCELEESLRKVDGSSVLVEEVSAAVDDEVSIDGVRGSENGEAGSLRF